MPSVLDRSALEQSPLADLHLLANELGVDGFRRLRKPELVDAILTRQSGEAAAAAAEPSPRPRPSPSAADGRRRSARSAPAAAAAAGAAGAATRKRAATRVMDRDEPPRRRSRAGVATAATSASSRAPSSCSPTAPASCACSPPEPTDDDVYISAAQVKRCELVSGDRDRRPDARGAPLRALPVADPRRHHQRPPGRGGRRGHALRGPAGRLAGRAHRARLRATRRSTRSSG